MMLLFNSHLAASSNIWRLAIRLELSCAGQGSDFKRITTDLLSFHFIKRYPENTFSRCAMYLRR